MSMLTLVAILLLQESAGPLGGLPGAEGPHVEKIRALGAKSWLELGAPAPDPKWGRARGRSWTSIMPYAPELRGAFLFGEGVHGYSKPEGRYMDDLWFYDVLGHRWICCYPGADTKTLSLKVNADGFESTAEGDLIPVASQVHGYQMNTYDTDLHRFVSMPNLHGYWKRDIPQRKDWVQPAPADASPWFFESRTGKWNRVKTGTPAPKSSFGDTLHYIPSMKKVFFAYRSKEVYLYDTAANRWEKPAVSGTPPPFGIEANSCYDSKRQRIYIGGGIYPQTPDGANALWIFDLKTNAWIDPKPQGAPCRGKNRYTTRNALLVYDARNDVVLLSVHPPEESRIEEMGIYTYDPNANAWAAEPVALPDKLARDRKVKNGFYSPDLEALFLHSAGDSRDDGVIWVYRTKGASQ
jgi:hypothetical protein